MRVAAAGWGIAVLLGTLGCGDRTMAARCEPVEGPATVTTTGLLNEASDLHRLGERLSHRSGHASSADPSSVSPDDPTSWFSNRDRGHFDGTVVRDGREEWVLLDTAGPGALTRLWTATVQGTLRVYLDCEPEPAVEVGMDRLFDGQHPPMGDPFAYSESVIDGQLRAGNLYFPIPFQSRVLVTHDMAVGDPETAAQDLFYQVGHRRYPAGTGVVPYAPSPEVTEAADAVGTQLGSAALPADPPAATALLGAGSSPLTVEASVGGSEITALRMRPSTADPIELRRAILVMTFDGEETVRVPLGDFFGTRAGQGTYGSLAMAVREGGTYASRWAMPYAAEAELSVEVPGGSELAVDTAVWTRERTWTDRSLHFHASWSDSGVRTFSPQDVPVVAIQGTGTYVGTTLSVVNDSECWWGEGDERIWVDDDEVPTVRGTGVEDYFGAAWGVPETFARPYHGQTIVEVGRSTRPCGSPIDFGGVSSMYRWHVLDPIPFDEALRFDLELWHWDPEAHVVYETVSYWYARPGAAVEAGRPVAGEPLLRNVGDL